MLDMNIRVNNEQFELIIKLLTKLDVLLKIRYIEKIDNDFYCMVLNHINRVEYKAIKNITDIPNRENQ